MERTRQAEAAREGEWASWVGLEELRGALRSFLRRHSRDENEIDDVIQETFLRAASHRERLSEPRRLKSWAMRIAINVLADARRRERWQITGTAADGVLDAHVQGLDGERGSPELRLDCWQIERDSALTHLRRAKGSMRPEDRAVLDSFYQGSESCQATSDECGIPPHLVKLRLFRARRRLLRLMRRRFACCTEAEYARGPA